MKAYTTSIPLKKLSLRITCAWLFAVVFSAQSYADSVTWNGNSNNNWRSNSNWDDGDAAGNGDIATFPADEGRNAVDLSDSSGDDVLRDIRRLNLETDGTDTTSETSPASNWYFRGGAVATNFLYWKHSTNNQSLIFTGDLHVDAGNLMLIRGNNGESTALHLYGDFTGSGTIDFDPYGGDDPIYLYSALSFTGELDASDATVYIRHDDALANLTFNIIQDGSLDFTGYNPHVGHLIGDTAISLPQGQTLTVGSKDLDGTYSGVFSGQGSLTKTGTGVWTLSGENTHSGETAINGGEIKTDGLDILSHSHVAIGASGTLNLLNGGSSPLTLGGLSGSGFLQLNNHIILKSAYFTSTFSGTLNGTRTITHEGAGQLTVTGSLGNFSGNVITSSTGGKVKTSGARFKDSNITVNGDQSLVLLADTTLGSLEGAGDLDLDHHLTIGEKNNSRTYSGDLLGNGDLTKAGTGTWFFNGAKTGSGAVTISAGKLGGTGSLSGNTTIASTAALAPGKNSTDTITFSDDLDLNGDFEVEFDGVWEDRVNVAGALDITGADLVPIESSIGITKAVYVIARYGSLSGTFATTSLPNQYYMDYAYDDGTSSNNIALVWDATPPTLDSITLGSAYSSPSSADSVSFDIVFSEDVTGVDASDFNISYTGGAGSATLTGSGAIYTLTVPSISGDGDLAVSLPNGSGIVDRANNTIASSSVKGSVEIDNSEPTVSAITPVTSSLTNASSLQFSVVFDEGVTNFDTLSDINVIASGVSHTGGSISGSGDTYTVTLTGAGGDGTVAIQVVAGMMDSLGNVSASNSFTGGALTVDNTTPVITHFTTAETSPIGADSISYDVTFSEEVSGFEDGSDLFIIVESVATTDLDLATIVTSDNKNFTVTLNGVAGDGLLGFRPLFGNVRDLANNSMAQDAANYSPRLVIDNTAPVITSFTTVEASPTAADSISYNVTFSEEISGFEDGSDLFIIFESVATTDLDLATIVNAGNNKNFTVTLNGVAGDGLLGFRPLFGNVRDLANNSMTQNAANYSPRLVIDNTAPVITSFTMAEANPTSADSISYEITFSEEVSGFDDGSDIFISVESVATTDLDLATIVNAGNNTNFTVTLNGVTGDGRLGFRPILVNVRDLAGNPMAENSVNYSPDLVIDNSAPVITSFTTAEASPTAADSISYSIRFSEEVSGFDDGSDLYITVQSVVTTDLDLATIVNAGDNKNFTVTLNGVTGDGLLGFRPKLGNVRDLAGNSLLENSANYSPNLVIDNIEPVVTSITTTASSPTSADSVQFSVEFDETVTDFDSVADLSVTTTDSLAYSSFAMSGSESSYTITFSGISGAGKLSFVVRDDTGVIDLFGNTLASSVDSPVVTRAAAGSLIHYVNASNATPVAPYDTWETAASTLQDALLYAASGDQVWVAAGVYYPDEGGNETDDDTDASFTMKSDVALYGGFAGAETLLSAADPDVNFSVLSGDLTRDDTNADGNFIAETSTDIINFGQQAQVLYADGITEAVLDGFVITAGRSQRDGGGLMAMNGAVLTVARCVFSGNYAGYDGGAFYSDNATSTLSDCSFVGNDADEGGAFYSDQSTNTLTNCSFTGNDADEGGAFYSNRSSSTLTNCSFTGNSGSLYGGAFYSTDSTSTLINSSFTGNSTDNEGGAFYSEDSTSTLTNCSFSGNSGLFGGAFRTDSSTNTLTHCSFSGNSAVRDGGSFYSNDSTSMIANGSFSGNYAGDSGGALVFSRDDTSTLTNCSFSGNRAEAETGGAIRINNRAMLDINNCILWNNQDNTGTNTASASLIDSDGGSTITTRNSLIANSGGSEAWNAALGTDGGGNFDADPLFVTAGDPAITPNSIGDFRLLGGSPALDAGDDSLIPFGITIDLQGAARIQDIRVDMGAYEGGVTYYEAWAINSGLILGVNDDIEDDADSDGRVNLLEYAFGLDPLLSDSGALEYDSELLLSAAGDPVLYLKATNAGANFWAMFVRRVDYKAAGLTYTPLFSYNLTDWEEGSASPLVMDGPGYDPDLDLVRVDYPFLLNDGHKARFFCIQVEITFP